MAAELFPEMKCRTCRAKALRISDLPYDIHLYILNFLDPRDLLSLQQTCSLLSGVINQRIVWIDALIRVCASSAIFLPTFPMDQMSLQALKSAATSPRRFALYLSKSNSGSEALKPYRKYALLSGAMDHSISSLEITTSLDMGDFRNIYLIPGGRFVLTFSMRRVCLWDLGHYASVNPPTQRLLSYIDCVFEFIYTVHSTPDGHGIRLFIARDELQPLVQFQIYDIYPLSSVPIFEKVADLKFHAYSELNFYSLCGDRFFYLDGNVLNVWNFKLDLWASWKVVGHFRQIIVSGNTVSLLHDTGVYSWVIPPLLPKREIKELRVIRPRRIFKLNEIGREDDFESRIRYEGPCDWYTDTPQPLLFDFVDSHFDRAVHSRYMLNPKDNEDLTRLDSAPALVDKFCFTLDYPENFLFLQAEPHRICGESLVTYWATSKGVEIHCGEIHGIAPDDFEVSREHSDGRRCTKLALDIPLQHELSAMGGVSLCPFSGRLCYILNTSTINIIDYITPYPEASHLETLS